MMRAALAVIAATAVTWATPAPAAGFGFTAGPQLEERLGGDYGPEYYEKQYGSRSRPREPQASARCRSANVKSQSRSRQIRVCPHR
jgi:hypothetical protein